MSVKQVFNTSAELDYPTVLPTLDLDFANSKTLDPRITFTRASGGSYVGADGLIKYAGVNEARFDHDPVTGESLGLLIEEARTNLLPRSEEFNDASWIKIRSSIVENAFIAPDGTLTAEKLIENVNFNTHTLNRQITGIADNASVSFSVFAKKAERDLVIVGRTKSNAFPAASYNLSNGTISNLGAGVTASMVSFGNGWYRCFYTYNVLSGANVPEIFFIPSPGAGLQFYQGDGTSGVYLWGAQAEAGAFPTSYIPTQASTRTRDIDTAIITQNNFNWYNGTEGTILLEHTDFPFNANAPVGFPAFGLANTADGTSLFTIQYFINARFGGGFFLVRNGILPGDVLNDQVGINFGLAATGSKVSFTFKKNNFAIARNGILVGTDNLGVVPDKINVSMLIIGLNNIFSNQRINCHCKYLKYYPKRLPNAQLQALTS
jgi:hypothetical protein